MTRDRRLIGAALLFLAVIGLIVASKINNPTTITGVATAQPPASPAVVGECLTSAAPYPVMVQPDGTVVPHLPLGACDQPHWGEVFAVVDAEPSSGDPRSLCWNGAVDPRQYLGVADPVTGVWTPTFNFDVALTGPDVRQYAAGQRWTACVITTPPGGEPFARSLRSITTAALAPTSFGFCAASTDPVTSNPVSCETRHLSETFADMKVIGPGATQDDLDASCLDLVVEQSGQPDLPAEPGLRIGAQIFIFADNQVQATTAPLAAGVLGQAYCVVSSDSGRRLQGPLLGLGAAPVPWFD